jgi:type I restriction enzyme, S subunit
MTPNCNTPSVWKRKRLSDIFEIRASGDIDWTRWSRVQNSAHPHPVYANGRADSGLHGYASYAVEQGDAITVTARGTLGELGFAFFREAAFTPIGRLLVLRSKGEADACFFASYINCIIRFAQENTGVAQLTAPQVVGYEVEVPPIEEQRAIATALSDVDDLLAKIDQLIAKKRDLKQAAMQQLLTGQTRLPGFSGEWEVKRLGDVGDCLRGVTYKGDSDLWPHDTTQTKRLLRSNNVQNANVVIENIQFVNTDRVSEHQLLKANDILICMANGSKALVGKAGLFNVSDGYIYTFGAFMGCFRSNTVASSSSFVFYLFQTGRYRNYINNLLAGSSINNLSPGSIESLEFQIPPMPEQSAIATVLSDMDVELAALEVRRDKTRALKQGMMQALLTGRIRLVGAH